MKRFLLGQLCMNGDCLSATILARQIKHDHPDSHLTWAISSFCKPMIENNPDVDEIWEIPVRGRDEQENAWYMFESVALRRFVNGDFDKIYLPQLWPNNMQNFDGTIRPSMLRVYGRPITVPIKCVLRLTPQEIECAEAFAREHRLDQYRHRILVESNSMSRQSYLTPEIAEFIAEMVLMQEPDCCFIMASNEGIRSKARGIIDASRLSIREVAALSHHASLFVGSASGLTIAVQSTAGKHLPTILLLSGPRSVFASFVHDHEYWGLPVDDMIELVDMLPGLVARCVLTVLSDGVAAARSQFHKAPELRFDDYLATLKACLLGRRRYLDAMQSLTLTANRYGWLPDLLAIGVYTIIPGLLRDPRIDLTESRLAAEAFAQDVTARWRQIGG